MELKFTPGALGEANRRYWKLVAPSLLDVPRHSQPPSSTQLEQIAKEQWIQNLARQIHDHSSLQYGLDGHSRIVPETRQNARLRLWTRDRVQGEAAAVPQA